jgi:CheY-like chemotaxis protein
MANVENYSLILLDISMPDMDGIEVATILRETGLKIPIIAVTATSNLKSQCLEVGMNGFIDKPINTVELDEILNKWCS